MSSLKNGGVQRNEDVKAVEPDTKREKSLGNMRKFAKISGKCANKRANDHAIAGAPHKTKAEEPLLKSASTLNVKKLNFHYPERTDGSEHARELRERTNQLGDKERAALFERAMQRIYGSPVKTTGGAGH